MVKSLIITGFGINCEIEMAKAYHLAGAQVTSAHLNELFSEKYSIHDFDIINFPGGFSFGDNLGAGKVFANKVRYRKLKNSSKTLFDEIQKFLEDKNKFILGICNGFQILVKLGLLPNINGNFEQKVTLTINDSGLFEDRWCHFYVNSENNSPFLKDIDIIDLPIRHKEGKLLFSSSSIKKAVIANNLNCLTYCNLNSKIATSYPVLPNGSELSCAALTNLTGQILGMMPHPEAYLSFYNHPEWPTKKRFYNSTLENEDGEGLKFFRNIVHHLRRVKNGN